jgi:hypothetical protein
VVGTAGLLFVVLVFTPVIWASTMGEPDFAGSPADIRAFFVRAQTPLAGIGGFLEVVGVLAFVWFAVGLAVLLQRREEPPAWRSAVAGASAVVFAAVTLNGHWAGAAYRGEDLGEQVLTHAFDLGNIVFANSWVALGSLAVCVGWLVLVQGFAARWIGWTAVVAGFGLVAARAVWTTNAWFVPYALFWVWFIALCVGLLRGRVPHVPA